MPSPVLVASYALHFVATVVWIGGLILLAFFPTPVPARRAAGDTAGPRRTAPRSFVPVQWLCLAVFVATGLIQMSANPAYVGMFAVTNLWAATILVKHLLVGLMAAILAYQTWVLYPRLERGAFGLTAEAPADQERLARVDRRLLRLSAGLGILILLLTAVARSSN